MRRQSQPAGSVASVACPSSDPRWRVARPLGRFFESAVQGVTGLVGFLHAYAGPVRPAVCILPHRPPGRPCLLAEKQNVDPLIERMVNVKPRYS